MSPGVTQDDLRQIIRRIEEKHRARRVPRARSLEDVLGGEVEDTGRGAVLLVRARFPVHHRHGARPLAAAGAISPAALALLARAGDAAPADPRRLLYLDAETTGLAGGTGTYAFLVGVGFFDADAFEVRQYFMRDLDDEPALLAALETLLGRFAGVVTYNGSGFDLPLLETRFVLARRPWRDEVPHLDLLRPARRLWSGHFPDCRLGTVEQRVLSFERDDDLPGALIPSVYFEYLRGKDPSRLPRVFEHNRHDVLSLAGLAGWMGEAVSQTPGLTLHPQELAGLGRLWERTDPERSASCYRMAIDSGLESPGRERILERLARASSRQARWAEARAFWAQAARAPVHFDPLPWVEMAKIDEHRRRDLASARAVVEEALAAAGQEGTLGPPLAGLNHRLQRLLRRMERAGLA